MTKSKSTKLTALLLALVLVTSCFVGGTLARYVTSTSSEDSARVAVWGINADEVEMDLFDATYTVNGVTVAQSEDGDNIIAPGTEKDNYFSIVNLDDNLKPEVMYEVAINLDDSEIDPLILNNPSIVWRLDEGTYGTWEETKAQVLALSGDASGVKTYAPLEIAENFKSDKTHKIGWKWIMDNNNNVMDTEMGNKAATDGDISAKISIKVTATQVNVDTTGMLDGNGQVYDINNPTPLVFRSAAPADELVEVKVGDETLTKNTDYTVDSGSTVITLTESCINRLGAGNYTISIISENMTAKATFGIAEIGEAPTTLIPEGGVYYQNVEIIKEPIMDNEYFETYQIGYYPNATKLQSGEAFPTEPKTGDAYIYGDYEYRYNVYLEFGVAYYMATSLNGWGAFYIGEDDTPGELLEEINGIPVNSLSGAFTYTNQWITSAPVIHSNINRIDFAFTNCSNLTGAIEINSTNLNNYTNAFFGTNITEITGTISEELKQKLLATKSY